MSEEIKKRIFLVGAARSGTTLLQSLITAHSEIFTFPETHFFTKTIPMRRSKRQLWRFKSKNVEIVKEFLANIKYDDEPEKLLNKLNINTWSLKEWTDSLLAILDRVTLKNGFSIWLEKTPAHLRYIHLITRRKPETHFIHIIRNGEDVIASLYEATHEHTEKWGTARSIDNCIIRWRRDISISKGHLNKKNHSFVLYEELVERPNEMIMKLCEDLQLPFEEEMMEKYKDQASKIVLSDEAWKDNTAKDLAKRSKFNKVFTEEEQHYIKEKIKDIDISIFSQFTN